LPIKEELAVAIQGKVRGAGDNGDWDLVRRSGIAVARTFFVYYKVVISLQNIQTPT
jgi:hypothetical protein